MNKSLRLVVDLPNIRYKPSTAILPVFFNAPYIIGIPTPSVGFDETSTATATWDTFNWDLSSIPIGYSTGSFTGTPPIIVTQQWQLNGINIAGAVGVTYTPVLGDVGGTLTVTQILSNAAGVVNNISAGVVVSA